MDEPEHLRPPHPDQTVVLLAEDDVMVQKVARIALELEGYFILTADHGEQALLISEKYPGAIHLLLADVQMPVMDGLRLKEQILTRRPDIKVLLISGQVAAPVDVPILRKPFGPAALRYKVKNILKTPKLYPPGVTVSS